MLNAQNEVDVVPYEKTSQKQFLEQSNAKLPTQKQGPFPNESTGIFVEVQYSFEILQSAISYVLLEDIQVLLPALFS